VETNIATDDENFLLPYGPLYRYILCTLPVWVSFEGTVFGTSMKRHGGTGDGADHHFELCDSISGSIY
jgi:hypothetical protein